MVSKTRDRAARRFFAPVAQCFDQRPTGLRVADTLHQRWRRGPVEDAHPRAWPHRDGDHSDHIMTGESRPSYSNGDGAKRCCGMVWRSPGCGLLTAHITRSRGAQEDPRWRIAAITNGVMPCARRAAQGVTVAQARADQPVEQHGRGDHQTGTAQVVLEGARQGGRQGSRLAPLPGGVRSHYGAIVRSGALQVG